MFETERLILREWQSADEVPMVVMGQDPQVMQYFPALLSAEETCAFISRIKQHQQRYGYSLYALERKDNNQFIGFTGLLHAPSEMYFAPAVEIGWRLATSAWHQGFATEAATEVLKQAFDHFGLDEIVSFTATINQPSQRVMQRIGLQYDTRFNHPRFAADHPLCQHVLYLKKTR